MRIVLVLGLAAIVAGCVSSGQSSPDPSGSAPASTSISGNPSTSPGSTQEPTTAGEPATPSPSPSPPPTGSPVGEPVTWTPIGSVAAGEGASFARGLVGFDGGYVAILAGLWHSVDGRSWQAADLPTPDPVVAPPSVDWPVEGAVPVAVGTDGQTVVVVGAYAHEPCDWARVTSGDTGGSPPCPASPISWVSTDGVHWRSSLPWVGPAGLASEGFLSGSAFSAVWSTPDGWETWLCYPAGSVCANREVWASADGLAWSRRSAMSDIEGEWGPPLTVVGTGGVRVAATSGFMRRSADGIAWTEVAFPADPGYLQSGTGPVAPGDPWVLTGAVAGPTIWRTSDLADWEQVSLPDADRIDGGSSRLIRSSSGYVAVAQDWPASSGMTWLSRDGVDWSSIAGAPVIGALADGPAGVIGLGVATDGRDLPVYGLR